MTTAITSDADLRTYVERALPGDPTDFDIDGIVAELGQDTVYGTTTTDDIDDRGDFQSILKRHRFVATSITTQTQSRYADGLTWSGDTEAAAMGALARDVAQYDSDRLQEQGDDDAVDMVATWLEVPRSDVTVSYEQ